MAKKDLKTILSCVLIGLSVLFTLYVIVMLEPGYYHADCTDSIMWAGASYDAGKLINPDFCYAAMMPFAANIIMWPLIAIFGLGLKAQIIGMVIFFLLFIAALIAVCRQISFSTEMTALTVGFLLFLLSSGEKLREIFWGHIIYYSFGPLMTLAILAAGFKLYKVVKDNGGKGKDLTPGTIGYGLLMIVLTFISGVNGVQIASISSIPVVGALFAYLFFETKTKLLCKENVSRYIVIGVATMGVLLGVVSIKQFTGGVEAGYANAYSKFAAIDDWTTNFLDIPKNLFTIMGATLNENTILFSGEGISILLRIVGTIILFGTPIVMLFQYKKIEKAEQKVILLTHHFASSVIIVGWTFGRLNAADWRLSPMIVTAVLCCMIQVNRIMKNTDGKRLAAIILIPFAAMSILTVHQCLTIESENTNTKAIKEVIEILEDENISYGYATFWNANIITMTSESAVEARCIKFTENGISPDYYQTNRNWYGKDGKKGKCFVLMTQAEFTEHVTSGVNSFIQAKDCGNFKILIYENNIFDGVSENAVY